MPNQLINVAKLDSHSWRVLSDSINRLEEAWRQKPSPDLSDFVVYEPDWLRQCVLIELIKVDQELAWQHGMPRKLEEYFIQWPEISSQDEIATELLRAECQTRCDLQTPPSMNEIRTRFPAVADRVDLASMAERATVETAADYRSTPVNLPRVFDESAISRRIGTTLDRYQIRAVLGHGGMGVVYRAWDPSLSREVALKIPKFDPVIYPDVAERFLREAETAAACRHSSICPVHDFGVVDGTYFIVMSLVNGRSLSELLRQGPIPPRKSAGIAMKLARALDCIHNAGLLHRDVSATNVIIDNAGEPVLMDFGLSRSIEMQLDPQICSGTPAYMAPEMLAKVSGGVDLRADIFSLGILLYQMLTGRLPEGTETRLKSPSRIAEITRPSKFAPYLDQRIEAICLRSIAEHPAKRYQSAAELSEALEEYLKAATTMTTDKSRNTVLVMAALALTAFLIWQVGNLRNSKFPSETVAKNQSPAQPVISELPDFPIETEPSDQELAILAADLKSIRRQMDIPPRLSDDPTNPRVDEFRFQLVQFLAKHLSSDLAVEAATVLGKLPWPTVEDSTADCVFWNRMPHFDEPSITVDPWTKGRVKEPSSHANELQIPNGAEKHHIHLTSQGFVVIKGRIQPNWPHIDFRLWVENSGPFHYRLISLTRGFSVHLKEKSHDRSNSEGTDETGHRFHKVQKVLSQPNNWIDMHVYSEENPADSQGDYLLLIWQPR